MKVSSASGILRSNVRNRPVRAASQMGRVRSRPRQRAKPAAEYSAATARRAAKSAVYPQGVRAASRPIRMGQLHPVASTRYCRVNVRCWAVRPSPSARLVRLIRAVAAIRPLSHAWVTTRVALKDTRVAPTDYGDATKETERTRARAARRVGSAFAVIQTRSLAPEQIRAASKGTPAVTVPGRVIKLTPLRRAPAKLAAHAIAVNPAKNRVPTAIRFASKAIPAVPMGSGSAMMPAHSRRAIRMAKPAAHRRRALAAGRI